MTYQSALIIDDDPLFHIVGEEMLRGLGVTKVVTAPEGDTGLTALEQNPGAFDLLLCDLQMPTLDGVSVIRELGQVGFTGGLIIVSGEDSDVIRTVRTMAQMVGVNVLGAIKKPLNIEELDALLKTVAPVARDEHTVTRRNLKLAFDERRLVPFYQPKIDLKTGTVAGLEVLARYVTPAGQVLGPAKYLATAEHENLMVELTMVIVEQVLNHARLWKQNHLTPALALNISPATLGELDLPDWLTSRVLRAGLDPKTITLEITEDRLMNYEANVLEVLSRFRLAGFRLSLDDFGTGATSIEQMRLYPFNELKIDRSFVQAALDDQFAMTTVQSSTRLAKMLGLSVVIEGVETLAQLRLAKSTGAAQAQGFLFSKAMPANAIADWMSRFRTPEANVA
ncbi:MAG: EAL domain-containing response regulator [Pseudomonadota bacterium]